jgi:hypothetical protein
MRDAELIENGNTQVSGSIVVLADPIHGPRPAVAGERPAMCQSLDEVA